MKQRIIHLDRQLTQMMQGWPPSVRLPMLGASFLGLPVVSALLVTVAILITFGLGHDRITLALLLCFVACGIVVLLKLLLQRQRPETLYALHMRFKTYSFPSGHSFSAFMFYGLWAYLLDAYSLDAWTPFSVWSLVVLIILVGLSRIYLGAHYLLDVLGGWLLGGVMLWLVIAAVQP